MSQQKRLLLTLAGVVVAAGALGAYAWFGVFQTEKAEEARKDAEAKLFALDPKDVVRLEITSAAKGTTTLVREDGAWRLASPLEAKADSAVVDALLGKLAEAKRKKLIEEKAADLAPFGLATPVVRVVAATASGQQVQVAIGAENTFDRSLFVSTGGELVATAEATLKNDLEKGTFDLRDKRVVVFGDDGLQAIVSTGSASWELARREDRRWQIGVEAADEKEAGAILRALHDLRATAFPTGDAAAFGLEAPVQTVELRRKDQPALTLRFGIADGKTYARPDDGPIAEVDGKILGDLRKSPADLRDRRVVPFDEPKVVALEFQSADATFRAERKKEGEGSSGAWSLVAPKEGKAKQWKLASALSTLKELRFDAGDATPGVDAGLDSPSRTVKVLGDGGAVLATLVVGAESDGKIWVKSAETGRVGKVDASRIQMLPKSYADAAEEAPPPEAAAAQAGD